SALGTTLAILRDKPDVVLLDVHMPGLSGDRLAELATPRKDRPHPLIILHSGSSRAELEELAKRCGAAGVIEKSSDPFDFMRGFEQVLHAHRRNGDAARAKDK